MNDPPNTTPARVAPAVGAGTARARRAMRPLGAVKNSTRPPATATAPTIVTTVIVFAFDFASLVSQAVAVAHGLVAVAVALERAVVVALRAERHVAGNAHRDHAGAGDAETGDLADAPGVLVGRAGRLVDGLRRFGGFGVGVATGCSALVGSLGSSSVTSELPPRSIGITLDFVLPPARYVDPVRPRIDPLFGYRACRCRPGCRRA